MVLTRTRRPWLFIGTLTVLLACTVWSYKTTPGSSLLVHKGASDTMSLAAAQMTDYWTLRLHLDPQSPAPGPRWVIDDAAHPGVGHELCWIPDRLGLQFYRASDQFLLGAVRLSRMPEAVDLVRRGPWFILRIDGVQMMSCLDPLVQSLDAHEAGAWFSQTSSGRMGDATITILDDPEPAQGPVTRDSAAAVSAMRDLLLLDDASPAGEIEEHLSQAATTMSVLPVGSQLHQRLRHYLALGVVRAALSQSDIVAARRCAEALDQLVVLNDIDPIPEGVGMVISALPELASRASSSPAVPHPAAEMLAQHATWMTVLADSATAAAQGCGPAVGDDLLYQLQLLAHAASCLQSSHAPLSAEPGDPGSGPRLLPAEAPPWIAARWRAFAGDDPGAATLPDPPQDLRREPANAALQILVQDAVLEPASALTLCNELRRELSQANVLLALAAPDQPRNAALLLATADHFSATLYPAAPYREAALARALLALRGVGTLDAACQGLTSAYGEAAPLAQRDPLAYALLELLLHQDPSLANLVPAKLLDLDPQAHDPDDPLMALSRGAELRPAANLRELANFGPLLSGQPDATAQAWRLSSAQLPLAQALACALAMQSLAQGAGAAAVDWQLLDQVRSYTLPLELLVPPLAASEPGGATGEGPSPLP